MEHIGGPCASEVNLEDRWDMLGSLNNSSNVYFGSYIVLQVLISPHRLLEVLVD